jgi:hypothetical protein
VEALIQFRNSGVLGEAGASSHRPPRSRSRETCHPRKRGMLCKRGSSGVAPRVVPVCRPSCPGEIWPCNNRGSKSPMLRSPGAGRVRVKCPPSVMPWTWGRLPMRFPRGTGSAGAPQSPCTVLRVTDAGVGLVVLSCVVHRRAAGRAQPAHCGPGRRRQGTAERKQRRGLLPRHGAVIDRRRAMARPADPSAYLYRALIPARSPLPSVRRAVMQYLP